MVALGERRWRGYWLGAALTAFVAGSAEAEPALDRLPLRPLSTSSVHGDELPRHEGLLAGIALEYAHRPVTLRDSTTQAVRLSPVDYRTTATAGVAFDPMAQLRLMLEAPLTLSSGGEPTAGVVAGSAGLGDLRLGAVARLLELDSWSLGVVGRLRLNTGAGGWNSSGRPAAEVGAVAEIALPARSALALQLGGRQRPNYDLLGVPVGDELAAVIGVKVPVGFAWTGSAEFAIAAPVRALDSPGAVQAEFVAAGHRALSAEGSVTLGMAAGLTDGWGAPVYRVFARVTFERLFRPDRPVAAAVAGQRRPGTVSCSVARPPQPLDADGDGIPDANDRCRTVAEDKDGVLDDDGCPETDPTHAAPTAIDAIRAELNRVHFRHDSDAIDAEWQPVLWRVARLLRTSAGRFELRGHTDDRGTPAHNADLSLRRAAAVRRALVQLGVPPARLVLSALGSDQPMVDDVTPLARAQNRRVEVELLKGTTDEAP